MLCLIFFCLRGCLVDSFYFTNEIGTCIKICRCKAIVNKDVCLLCSYPSILKWIHHILLMKLEHVNRFVDVIVSMLYSSFFSGLRSCGYLEDKSNFEVVSFYFVCLFDLMLYVPVNSNGHFGTVSSPN